MKRAVDVVLAAAVAVAFVVCVELLLERLRERGVPTAVIDEERYDARQAA
jgi:predicted kinase